MNLLKIIFIFISLLNYTIGFSQPLKMTSEIKMGHLNNGLTYFLIPNGDPGKVKLAIITKVGAYIERPDQHGYAHMIEHMLFQGSENYPGKTCSEEIELMGMRIGVDYNGYTGNTETEYFMTIPENDKDYFFRSLSILKDWMFNLKLEKGALENEKKVIVEEINRKGGNLEGSPNLIGTILEGHNNLGTKESVQKATAEGLYQFYKDNYIPSNLAVIVYGKMDEKFVCKTIKKIFSQVPEAKEKHTNHYIDINNETIVSGKYKQKSKNLSTKLVVLFKAKPIVRNSYSAFKEELTNRLFVKVVERRLSKQLGGSVSQVSVNLGSLIQDNQVFNFRFQLVKDAAYNEVFNDFCNILAQVVQYGVSKEEIQYESELYLNYQKKRPYDNSVMYSRVKDYFKTGDVPLSDRKNIELTKKVFSELKPDDFVTVAKKMIRLHKTILYDSTASACSSEFTESFILQKLDSLNSVKTEPYVYKKTNEIQFNCNKSVDIEIDNKLPAHIVKVRQVADSLKVYSYSNGIKVVLYQLNNGRFSVKMMTDKGLNYLPKNEREYFEKSLRYMINTYGDYSDKDARSIEKSMSITKNVLIDDNTYQFNVNGKSEYFDQGIKIFNLIVSECNYPDIDDVMGKLKRYVKKKNLNDDENSLLELSEDLIERFIHYDQSIKESLEGAIVFVEGSLPGNIEKLVSQYIGTLPSKKNEFMQVKKDYSNFPDSNICNNIPWTRGLAKIRYSFSKVSEKELSMRDEMILQGVLEHAHLKMTDVLRDKYGMVYASGKKVEISNSPFSSSALKLVFMTDTSNVRQVYDIMNNEVLMSLSMEELSDFEVKKIKAMLRSVYVMSFYEDKQISDLWIRRYLKFRNIYSPKELDKIIKSITKPELEECMHKIIDPERYIRTTYLPEGNER